MPQPSSQTATPRRVKFFIAAIMIWMATYVLVINILDHPHSAWIRGGAVALGICGFLAWVGAVVVAIRAENEFNQRIYLMGTASAFGATAVFIFAFNMLQRAGFVHYLPLPTILLVMFVTWALAMAFASRHYL